MTLTVRQRQVLSFAATGSSGREIGEILGLSAETVKCHLRDAYRSLGARNRADALLLAIEAGELTTGTIAKAPSPTTVRQSSHGAVAVYAPRGVSQPQPWQVVHAAGPYTFLQRLDAQHVAGWEVLYNHHHHGEAA